MPRDAGKAIPADRRRMDDCPSKEELSRKITELEGQLRRLKHASDAHADKHRQVLQSIEEGYYELDLKGNILSFNQAAGFLMGCASDELLGKNFRFFTTDATAHRLIEVFHRIYETGHPGRKVCHDVIRKDGSIRTHEISAGLMRDEGGKPSGFHVIVHDITARKQSETLLKKSEERYRAIFENTGNATILIAEDTTILLANTKFENLTGYTKAEMEGKMSWTVFIDPKDRERMKHYHHQRRKEEGSAPNFYEFGLMNRKGEARQIFLTVALIPNSSESVASCMDITDRERSAQTLRRSEERFRDLASLLPETVFETNVDGQFTFVNEISLERFGFTRQEVEQGVHVLDVMALKDHERVITNHMRVMQGERLGLSEYTARRKDGTEFPVLIHSTPIIQDGGYVGLRGFLIDITEKKNLEEQLMRSRKLEAIGTLAGGIAHDFNNLLMGLLGNITLMLMDLDESHPFHDRLKNMETYVQHGSDLTRQLLGFARGGKYEVKSTDLGALVPRSAEIFGRTKKEIRIHCKVDDHLWAVEVDRGQMEQVMLNLFVNAWQAMPGGGDMYLSLENVVLGQEEVGPYDIMPGRFVKITVTDTGVGMDEATKARIFEPFFSTRQRGRGTGLGLASVYGIIKNHGGFILVESQKAVGTSFMVHLSASAKSVEHARRTDDSIQKGSETVLLIDDEDMIVDIGTRILESLGYKVLTATGGSRGIEIFERNKADIDLVILDMIMPDLGGRDTFAALRRSEPTVKVLLSSGYSIDGQAGEILAQGCKGFIQKPFTRAELSKKVRQVLEEP
jgi:two-component system, cell cycle sensor histidine kinase and response regulator CckA